ncbi:MAG: hypothetical protein HY553_01540 [Elusimicrobia bacterium]|nr:hypothetical protein [Elusimicrobiota bacterium]
MLPALLAALAALPAVAQSDVAYQPVPGVVLTVHTEQAGQAPDAVLYQGPKGHYLLTREELFDRFAVDRGEEQAIYNLTDFTPAGIRHRWIHREPGVVKPYGHPSGAHEAESLIDRLGASKEEARPEAAARVRALRSRAARAGARRASLLAAESLAPGTVKDKAWLERLDSEIASATAAADQAEAELNGDADARFVRVARALRAAEYEMWKLENVLDWSPAGK